MWFQSSFPLCWTVSQMKSTMSFPRWTRRLPFRQCQHFEGGSPCSEVSSSFCCSSPKGGPHWCLGRGARRGFHCLLHHMVEFVTFCRKSSTVETWLCKLTHFMRVLLCTVCCNFRRLPCVCAQPLILTSGCRPRSFFFFQVHLNDTSW